jgi:hypothetical protein
MTSIGQAKTQAYHAIQAYLACKENDSCNKSQIKDITHRALAKLESEHPYDIKEVYAALAKGNNADLREALNNIVVSGKTPWHPNSDEWDLNDRQRMIFDIMRSHMPSIDKILEDKDLLTAVAWKKNTKLLDEVKDLVQKIFIDMEKTIKDPAISHSDSFHMEMIIGDLLSLFPFLRPNDGDILRVPVRVDGQWKMVDYAVEKIRLTPRWMGSSIMAYGLNAINAPPLLLFKGTTYPTDKGFGLSLLTDMNPFSSVGAFVYSIGKNKIENWLNKKNTSSQKAIVYGKSLGGAHAWRTALSFQDKVGKVMAYGASGLSISDNKKLNALKKEGILPEINIFCQKNDPVPYFDLTNDGINYYQVLGSKPRHGVIAHADMYSTHEKSVILKFDFSKCSQKIQRIAATLLRGIVSFVCFPFVALIMAVYTIPERSFHVIHRSIHKKTPKAKPQMRPKIKESEHVAIS